MSSIPLKTRCFQRIQKRLQGRRVGPWFNRGCPVDHRHFIRQVLLNGKQDHDPSFKVSEMLEGLSIKKNSILFLHVGLKELCQLTQKSPGECAVDILRVLSDLYEPRAVVSPAFTESIFRQSRIFSVRYSKPTHVGLFAEFFFKNSTFRTPDPFRSLAILTNSPQEFGDLDYAESFSEDGVFAHLETNQTYILNIATNLFHCTQLHRIETKLKVPYIRPEAIDGVLFDEANTPHPLSAIDYTYPKKRLAFHRKKIENCLASKKAIELKKYRDLSVSVVTPDALQAALEPEIKKDPYFLVSF